MTTQIHVCLVYNGDDYKLLPGLPSEHGLTATVSDSFTLGDEEAVFWLVNCDLTTEEIQALVRPTLASGK